MSKTIRCTSITEQVHELMNTFLVACKKIPKGGSILEICLRVSFLCVNECWKFDTITYEEYWSIVSNHIPVSFFCIEFDGKSTRISCSIGGSFLSTNGRETNSYLRFLSDMTEKIGIGLQQVSLILASF